MVDSNNGDDNRLRYMAFIADQLRLETELNELEVQRDDKRKQLERVRRIVVELGALCGIVDANNLSTLGITDACRSVITKAYPEYTSAEDVKEQLEQGGFDLTQYQNPYASIYTILSRLKKSGFAEKKMDGWKVLYRWKKRHPRMTRRQANAIRTVVNKHQE
jgi:hypothetical protein